MRRRLLQFCALVVAFCESNPLWGRDLEIISQEVKPQKLKITKAA